MAFVGTLVVSGAAVFGVCGAYVVHGPEATLARIAAASQAQDGALLADLIDFPFVRESLKEQARNMVVGRLLNDPELRDNPFLGLGAMFAASWANKLVDDWLTPSGVAHLCEGAPVLPSTGKPWSMGAVPSTPTADGPSRLVSRQFESMRLYRKVVTTQVDGTARTELILTRTGLRWRLTNVILHVNPS